MDEKSSLEEYGIQNMSPSTPNVSPDILRVAGSQVPYFRTNLFSGVLRENESMLLDLIGCENGKVIFLTTSGTGAMDAIVSNLVHPKETVLVINGGAFGQRWKDICDFYKIHAIEFKPGFGKRINFGLLESLVQDFRPETILMQHVETSSGQVYDVKRAGKLCEKYDSKLVVDAISSFLNEPYNMDDFNVDATVVSSQKGLGLFSGISMVVLNERLTKKKFHKGNFYFDFSKYLGDLKDMAIPFTPNINILCQLNHKLKQIKENGIEKEIEKRKHQAEHFRYFIKDLPLRIVAQDPASCVTALSGPREDIKEFFEQLCAKNIYFSPSKGEDGRTFVVSHMGDLNEKDNEIFVEELRRWLKNP